MIDLDKLVCPRCSSCDPICPCTPYLDVVVRRRMERVVAARHRDAVGRALARVPQVVRTAA